jgi:hypothetical protein
MIDIDVLNAEAPRQQSAHGLEMSAEVIFRHGAYFDINGSVV